MTLNVSLDGPSRDEIITGLRRVIADVFEEERRANSGEGIVYLRNPRATTRTMIEDLQVKYRFSFSPEAEHSQGPKDETSLEHLLSAHQ